MTRRVLGMLSAALFCTAGLCRPLLSPVVVPTTMTVYVEVYDAATDAKVPGAFVRYWYAGPTPDASVTLIADANGNTAFVIPTTVTASYMWVSAEGYVPADQHVDAKPGLHVRFHLAKPPPPPPPPLPRRHGLVRLQGRALVDDDGAFLGHGVTLFWGLWGYQHDRTRLEANLKYLADSQAVHYVRVLATVCGASWEDRQVDPRTPGYDAALAGLTDLAYNTYGLRMEWTVFGGVDCTPTPVEREALVDRVLAMSHGREQKIIHLEASNEGFQTGFGGDDGIAELRRLTRRLNDGTAILVAASSYHESAPEFCALYADRIADLATIHFDRSRGAEDLWRAVRQPWNYPAEFPACEYDLPPGSSNEPIGPYSSVADDLNPTRLISQVVVAHIAGLPLSVLHAGPGIWGGGAASVSRGIPADLWQTPHLADTLHGLAAVTAHLPPDLPAWSRQNSGWAGTPFSVDTLWPGTDVGHGAVRVYSATRGQAVVTLAFGIKQYVILTARWPMTVDVIRVATGEIVQTRTLAAGEALRLEEDLGAWLVVSK